MNIEVADIDIVHAEGGMPVHDVGSIGDQQRSAWASVDVGKERRDNLAARADESKRSVGRQRIVETDVAVVVDVNLGTLFAEEVDGKAEARNASGAVVVARNGFQ